MNCCLEIGCCYNENLKHIALVLRLGSGKVWKSSKKIVHGAWKTAMKVLQWVGKMATCVNLEYRNVPTELENLTK